MAERLTIAILGAGNIGGTLGRAWSVAGHRVCFGVRDLQSQKIQSLRQELGDAVSIGSIAQALATKPEVVVIAVPGNTVDGIVTTHAAQLDGRIIIDTANRIGGVARQIAFPSCRRKLLMHRSIEPSIRSAGKTSPILFLMAQQPISSTAVLRGRLAGLSSS